MAEEGKSFIVDMDLIAVKLVPSTWKLFHLDSFFAHVANTSFGLVSGED